jgi:predicted TIM-barrel fold metal-dependent hydrolase
MHAEKDALGRFRPPLMSAWRPDMGNPKELIRQHSERGVEKVLVLDPPEVAFELQAIFGEFVVPIPQVDMDRILPEEIDRLLARGGRGIKFICPMHSYGDNRYFPLYDVIRKRGLLAIFHTGTLADGLFKPGGVLGREDFVDITHMRPAALDRIARALPDLKILMAHFGNPWWEEAWTVLKSHKNIYADLSGGTARAKSMAMWRELFAPNGRLHTASAGKLCFASDATHFSPGQFGYSVHIEFYERLYEALQLPNDLRLKIDRENILHLIGSD